MGLMAAPTRQEGPTMELRVCVHFSEKRVHLYNIRILHEVQPLLVPMVPSISMISAFFWNPTTKKQVSSILKSATLHVKVFG